MSKIKHNDLVVKSNNLIEGFTNMSINEYKLTIHLISKINRTDKNFSVQEVSVDDFSKILEVSNTNIYTFLNKLENSLLSKKILITNTKGDRLKINWYSYTKYIKGTGILEVAFNSHLAPYLLNLNINYTKYFVKSIRKLKSFYSIRIYELLKQYEKIGLRIIKISKLREILGISIDKYKKYNHLKERIILSSQEDIENNSDIKFTFEEIKESRKVVAIKFFISSKFDNQILEKGSDNIHDKELETIKNEMEKIIERNVNINILKSAVKKNNLKSDDIYFYLKHWHRFSYKNKKDPVAFFMHCVINKKELPKKQSGNQINYNKPIQSTNFDQRKYDDAFFESLYDNFEDE